VLVAEGGSFAAALRVAEGALVAVADGTAVGTDVAVAVLVAVGSLVAVGDGTTVGTDVAVAVLVAVGSLVGVADGSVVGLGVGAGVAVAGNGVGVVVAVAGNGVGAATVAEADGVGVFNVSVTISAAHVETVVAASAETDDVADLDSVGVFDLYLELPATRNSSASGVEDGYIRKSVEVGAAGAAELSNSACSREDIGRLDIEAKFPHARAKGTPIYQPDNIISSTTAARTKCAARRSADPFRLPFLARGFLSSQYSRR